MNLSQPPSVWRHTVPRILLIALAYAALAHLGLRFAIPPGYATAVWPPSGLALAAVLIWGHWAALGVFLGSFLVNAWLTGIGAMNALLLPAGIAAGSALQASVGRILITRYSSPPWSFLQLRQALFIILLGGPLACLVSTTVGNSILFMMGRFEGGGFSDSWFNWWVGDALGVLVFAPILVMLVQPEKIISSRRKLVICLPLVFMYLFLNLLYLTGKNRYEEQLSATLDSETQLQATFFKEHINRKTGMLHSLAGLFEASEHVSREEFRRFYNNVGRTLDHTPTLGWAPRITPDQLDSLVARATNEGLKDFRLFEMGADGPQPITARDIYQPLFYIEPSARHPKAFGFDLFSESMRRAAIKKAQMTDNITVAGPLYIVGGEAPQWVYVLTRSLAADAGDAVLSIIWIEQLVKPLVNAISGDRIGYRLLDMETGEALYSADSAAFRSAINQSQPLEFLDRTLILESWVTNAHVAQTINERMAPLVVGGFFIIGAIALLLINSTGAQESAQKLVTSKTRELRQEREFLETIIDNLPMILYIKDAKTRQYVRVNKAGYDVMREEAPDPVNSTQEELFLSQMGESSRTIDDKVVFEKATVQDITHFEHRDEVLWFNNIKVPIEDPDTGQVRYILGLSEDITGQRNAERSISEARERFSLILEHIGEGLVGIDTTGAITFVNPAAQTLLGYSEDDLLQQNAHALFQHHYADGRPFPKDKSHILRTLITGTGCRLDDQVFWHRDGMSIPVEFVCSPIFEGGNIAGAVIVFNDISKRLTVERLQIEQTRRVQQANEDLEEFSYVASHDLQEPLRTLTCFCDFLEEDLGDDLPEAAATDLEHIKQASRRMSRLINDMLAYSRAGRASLELVPVDLADCLAQVQKDLALLIRERQAVITVSDELPFVQGERNSLIRVFQNLIQNSIRYCEATPPKIEVYVSGTDGNSVTIAVSDNGIGIEEQYLDHIFGAFRRLHNADEYEGSGIGLAVVKKLVEVHKGSIWVKSEPGHGSIFYVKLNRSII